jgi:hypothetical protein
MIPNNLSQSPQAPITSHVDLFLPRNIKIKMIERTDRNTAFSKREEDQLSVSAGATSGDVKYCLYKVRVGSGRVRRDGRKERIL